MKHPLKTTVAVTIFCALALTGIALSAPSSATQSTAGLWVDVRAAIQIPQGDEPTASGLRWLNLSVHKTGQSVSLSVCTSGAKGACKGMIKTDLPAAEVKAFAARVNAVLSMPRCEPLGIAKGLPFELALGADIRTGRLAPQWLSKAPPNPKDPCYAEVHLAHWLHGAWARRRPPEGG